MSVTAAQGIFGFGPQSHMGALPVTWMRHRATLVDLDVADPVLEGPLEVGGIGVPTFPYKPGPIVGGGATIMPRFENTLGWFLYDLIGTESSAPVAGHTGIYDHTFSLPDYAIGNPWLGLRKYIPKNNGASGTDMGQVFTDCKVIGSTLTLPNDAPVSMRLDFLGREAKLEDPSGWTWGNDYEGWESIPVGCVTGGYINVDGSPMPIVGANITFQNVPLDPRQERVFGSPFLEDITTIQRRLTYDMIVKWHNPDLYQKIFSGAVDAMSWSSHPYTASFEARAVSSENIGSDTIPYQLTVSANSVLFNLVGGLVLAAGQSILMRFTGVALEHDDGYATFVLRNGIADYTWPLTGSGS